MIQRDCQNTERLLKYIDRYIAQTARNETSQNIFGVGMMSRQLRCRMGTFGDLTLKFKQIQLEPSRNHKNRMFREYVHSLQPEGRRNLKSLLELSLSRFSRISDKTLINQCDYFHIHRSSLQEYLNKENDILNAISDLYARDKVKRDLEVEDVLDEFLSVKEAMGDNSRGARLCRIEGLLARCVSRDERRMVLSLLTGSLQIGFEKVQIQRALQELVPEEKSQSHHLYNCMLTKPLSDFNEALKFIKDSEFYAEFKFDGERAHIQYRRNQPLQVFSRNGKSRLQIYPDIEEKILSDLNQIQGLESCILDGEIICVDSQEKVTPIQVLLNRKGKSRANMNAEHQERIMVFDVLETNGQPLLNLPYFERTACIPDFKNSQIFRNVERRAFKFPQSEQEFMQFFKESVGDGYEGLILKKAGSIYDVERGRKDWAKLKKGETEEGTAGRSVDVDLILMGAFRGKGKRKGILGSFLFGALHNGKIYPITKTGTTLTDSQFQQVSTRVEEYIVPQAPQEYVIPKRLPKPDIWVKPHFVVEIFSQEWTRSPVYEFDEKKEGGLSLRFPTFIRIREDKGVNDSTQGKDILELIK